MQPIGQVRMPVGKDDDVQGVEIVRKLRRANGELMRSQHGSRRDASIPQTDRLVVPDLLFVLASRNVVDIDQSFSDPLLDPAYPSLVVKIIPNG